MASAATSQPTHSDTEAYKDTLQQFKDVTQAIDQLHVGSPTAAPRSDTPQVNSLAAPQARRIDSKAQTPPVCVVHCPKCKHSLRVPSQESVHATYQCPGCMARFIVARDPDPQQLSSASATHTPLQHHSTNVTSPAQPPSQVPSLASQGSSTAAITSDKMYEAVCPRCSQTCRFMTPQGASSKPTRIAVQCSSCHRPFAIQV